jgi:magnesium transporter
MTDIERAGSSIRRTRRRAAPGAPPGTLIADPASPRPRIRAIAYGEASAESIDIETPEALDGVVGHRPVTWIDVQGLGDTDVLTALGRLFNLHMLALEDVVNVHQRPKVEEYEDHLFVCTRMPQTEDGRHLVPLKTEQVSIFLGRNFILTFQERPGDCFDQVRRRITENRGRIRKSGPDYLLYALLDAVTDAFFPVLEQDGERLEALEAEAMNDAADDINARIHRLKRELLAVRRCVWPQREMLNVLIRDDSALVSDQTRVFLRDCFDHTIQLMDLLETYREVASDLVDIHLSTVSKRLNEVMMVLTIIATIFMPLTVIVGIYGMNFDTEASPWNMPELRWAYGYPFALGLMLAVAGGMLLWFRRRGWLGRLGRHRRKRGGGAASD